MLARFALMAATLFAAPLAHSAEIVTPDNYVEAEVDLTLTQIVDEVGSNAFRHDRGLIPLDKQPAVTMNRDTIYSFGIFDTPAGTTITLPESKDNRYQSAMLLQTDHYIDQVLYGPGTFEIVSETPFVGIAIRTQVDAADPEDVTYVTELQDRILMKVPDGAAPRDYQPRDWDMPSLETLRAGYQTEAAKLPNFNETSGAHGTIDPQLQRLGVSVALGLLPPEHAMYVYREYGLKGDACYEATYERPGFGDRGFFSFTMYGADKYLHSENSNLNDRTIAFNDDGTFTLHYGRESACGDVPNRLDTPGDDWMIGLRVYRPDASVLAGEYQLPVPTAVR